MVHSNHIEPIQEEKNYHRIEIWKIIVVVWQLKSLKEESKPIKYTMCPILCDLIILISVAIIINVFKKN